MNEIADEEEYDLETAKSLTHYTKQWNIKMNVLTVPKKFLKNDDLILIPRSFYELLIKNFNEEIKEDCLYEEPVKSELKKRIKSSKTEIAADKLTEWKLKKKRSI